MSATSATRTSGWLARSWRIAALAISTTLGSVAVAEPVVADRAVETQGIAALITGPRQAIEDLVSGQPLAEIRLIPKTTHPNGAYNIGGYYDASDISGERLTVVGGGRTYWNIYISGWGADGNSLRVWQGLISPQSMLGTSADCGSGPGSCPGAGNLLMPTVACSTAANCTTAFGEAKVQNLPPGCAPVSHCRPGSNICETAYINDTRSDWIFRSLVNPGDLCYGCTTPPWFGQSPKCLGRHFGEMPDGGLDYYAGTLVIDVAADARGLYRLQWDPVDTFYADLNLVGYAFALYPGELMVLQDPCACNGDVSNNGAVSALDIAELADCIRGIDCSGCVNSCDIDCDGYIDYADLGGAICDFQAGGSVCCNEPIGACEPTHQAFPDCIETTERACEDPFLLNGTYYGDNTACPGACGAAGDPPCAANEFCNFPVGTCANPPDGGMCQVRPAECPLTLWDPVCGCDGVTYAYDCFAYLAGVSIDYWGECGAPACFATRSFGDTTYCPGNTDSVTIDLSPPLGTDALAVEDSPPAGWSVGAISNGGFYDAANHKVKWGPFFAPIPGQVSYELTPVDTGIQCFSGTVSVDGNNSAVCGDPCEEEMCCDHMAAETAAGDCIACAVGNCAECSTGACEDGSISLCEVISYGCAWMRGCNDDIGGMTRAAYIWHNGECYCWDTGPGNWVATSCGAGGNVCCAAEGAAMNATAAVQDGFSSLEVSPSGDSGQWLLSVQLAPAPGTSASAVEVLVPKRWRVISVSGGGRHDATFSKIKWGPFFEDTPRTLTATVQASPTQKSEMGRVSSGQKLRLDSTSGPEIKGTASFDGINQPLALEE